MSHASVAEAAVVGQRDSLRGEVIVAFVTARPDQSPDSDQLRQFCRERGLPPWKIPREIYLIPELPRSPTGKILKRELHAPHAPNAPKPPSSQ